MGFCNMKTMILSSTADLLIVLCLVCYIQGCFGHGMLVQPRARNVLYNSDYCPQCLSAGGPYTVSNKGQLAWPNGKYGICGDPYDAEKRHEAGGIFAKNIVTGNYIEGQVIKLQTRLTAFHKGYFEFKICRIAPALPLAEKNQLTEECLRAGTLKQANVEEAQSPGSSRYYVGQMPSGESYIAHYQLPMGLTCDGVTAKCVLQWHYVTGNSCNPPGTPDRYGASYLATCGAPYAPYPEEFWNCADIVIMPRMGRKTPSPTPKKSPPSPKPKQIRRMSPPPPPPPKNSAGKGNKCAAKDAQCICKAFGQDGLFPDIANKCYGFVSCSSSNAWYQMCPPGLKFDSEIMACNWANQAKC